MSRPGYLRPASLAEATATLAGEPDGARVLAGGTDLLVSMRRAAVRPGLIVDISGLGELAHMVFGGDGGAVIGAMATHSAVVGETRFAGPWGALADASGQVGSWQVRNLATVGGNLCNASPAAETASPLLVMGARVTLATALGSRELDLEEFFLGPGVSALTPGELLTHVRLPPPLGGSGSAYMRVSPRRAMDIAVAGAAAYVQVAPDGRTCSACRIAVSGVAPTPVRARDAEAAVTGAAFDRALAASAGCLAAASDVCMPIDDHRASCEYRRAVVPALVERALRAAWARAGG